MDSEIKYYQDESYLESPEPLITERIIDVTLLYKEATVEEKVEIKRLIRNFSIIPLQD